MYLLTKAMRTERSSPVFILRLMEAGLHCAMAAASLTEMNSLRTTPSARFKSAALYRQRLVQKILVGLGFSIFAPQWRQYSVDACLSVMVLNLRFEVRAHGRKRYQRGYPRPQQASVLF